MQVNQLDQTAATPEGASPMATTITNGGQEDVAEELTTAAVVCPFLFEDVDAMLTNEADGSPTLLYHGCVTSCVAMALASLAGTFVTPGLPMAWAAGDPLLGLALVANALVYGVGVPMLLAETRRTCRGAAGGGPLPQLGAGTAPIPAKEEQALRKLDKQLGFHKDAATVVKNLPSVLLALPSLIMGWGLQSPTQNRLTAAAFIAFVPALAVTYVWIVTLKTATAVIATRIATVAEAVEGETRSEGQDMSEDQWGSTVTAPCRAMIREMQALTEGWARGVLVAWGMMFWGIVALVCLALSPVVAEALTELGERLGATWLLVAFRVFFFALAGFSVFLALEVASGPAEVSTQADDLKERLNDVRVSDFSREADEKVAIIERALSSANHGQGVGFQVVGTVIDQRKLQQIGMRLVAGAQVFVPLVLAFSVYGVDDAVQPASQDQPGGSGSAAKCGLTPQQVGMIKAMFDGAGDNCSFANVTIGAVLAM
jgi:hypothetical protein